MKKMTVRMAGRNIMQNQISMLNQLNSPPRPSIIKDSVESSKEIDPSVRIDSSLKAPRCKGSLTVGFNSVEQQIPGLNRLDLN